MENSATPAGVLWLNNFSVVGPELILKGFLVVGLLMYAFFALVVLKQVGIMTETFESEINGTVKTFAWMHFLLSIFLLFIAIVVL